MILLFEWRNSRYPQKRIEKMQGEIASFRMVDASKEAALHGYYIIGSQVFEDITNQSAQKSQL